MKILEKVIFILFIFFLFLFIFQYFSGEEYINNEFVGVLFIFFYGFHILMEYATGQVIGISGTLRISEGDFKEPKRLLGAAIGISVCSMSIYMYYQILVS